MKGRKHDLNHPFDPAAVSDPACWLPVEIAREIEATLPMTRRMGLAPRPATPSTLDASQHVTEDEFGTLHFQDGAPE